MSGLRSGRRIKPEPAAETNSPPIRAPRELTPCPSTATLAEQDISMPGTETVHSNLHQELLDASTRQARLTPLTTRASMSTPVSAASPAQGPSTSFNLHRSSTQELTIDNGAIEGDFDGINALGQKVKYLVETMDKLQQLGIETTELPLPKIVVVGDQSAGKSSLVEGISEIKVPRSSGTCTRCPLQITLTASTDPSSRWTCCITLQKKYSLYSESASHLDASPYGRWQPEHTCEETFFQEVYNTTDLEDALRRAQVATLNPGVNPQQYLTVSNVENLPTRTEFSPNPIRLDITGPGLPALSFFDLPGVINQTAAEEDRWMVSLVKNLVTEYIQQENSLILLACSMENDLQNSSASALVAGCRGANERTVAVLTKPDRFPAGNPLGIIQKILDNRSFRVGHGYYVTKQPSQLDLDKGITIEQARTAEDAFFAAAPWSTRFAVHQARFGTVQLRDALSQKLTQQILVSLPTINDKVRLRLDEVEEELERYPDPPENALGRVLEALNNFAIATERHIEGTLPFNGLRNSVRKLTSGFEKGLRSQRPTILVNTPPGFTKQGQVTINLLSDDESEIGSRPQTPAPAITPAKKRKLDAMTPSRSVKVQPAQSGTGLGRNLNATHKKYTLLQIRETLERLSLSDIPNEIDPRAVDHLRRESLARWDAPMEVFLNHIAELLQVTLERVLQEACEQWIATDFYKESKKIVRTFVVTVIDEQRIFARRAFQLESYKPMTMDEHGIAAQEEQERRALSESRYHKRLIEYYERKSRGKPDTDEDRKKMEEWLRKARTDQKLSQELGPDPFTREIEVIARVRGYYNVALLRFLDHVIQGIQAEAFAKCRTELHAQLRAGLEVDGPQAQEHCDRLLAENADREVRRIQLKKERENLLEAQQWLAGLRDAGF